MADIPICICKDGDETKKLTRQRCSGGYFKGNTAVKQRDSIAKGSDVKIGVIADTHDRLEKMEKAVAFFNSNDLDMVIHAGDFIAPFTAPVFSDLKTDMIGVFGNNDGDKKNLLKAYSKIAHIHEPPFIIKDKKKKIVVVHNEKNIDKLLKENDIVIYAHTHRFEVKKEKNKLLVNPGECCGYMYHMSSVAILDTDKLEANIFQLQ